MVFGFMKSKNKTEIINIITEDLLRYTSESSFKSILRTLRKNESFNFSFWFRLCSYENKWIRKLARKIYKNKCKKYNIYLPVETRIEGGLYIGHVSVGGICINPNTIIGKNFTLSHQVTIGSNKQNPAIIGDNVYIAPHVCIVENVIIGNNIKIGAGAVVIHDIPDNVTAVGVPARVVKK